MTTLTKRYRFSASHRLHSPQLSDSKNAEIFGKCNNPYGHGHDYVLSVTVMGDVDSNTGILMPVQVLDRLVYEQVLQMFSFRNINIDIPQFADLVPTTENIAFVIANLLQEHWSEYVGDSGARLYRVHIQETARNGFELLIPTQAAKLIDTKGLLVHA